MNLFFDRQLLRKNQQRFLPKFTQYNFLHQEVAKRLIQNLEGFDRVFENAVEVSSKDNFLSDLILKEKKVKKILRSSLTDKGSDLLLDDENLPFKPQIFDLILSNLNLQHINLVPQFLVQSREILQKDGILAASFFGENNLIELKKAVYDAEDALYQRVSPRFIPVIDVKNAGALWQKAGFVDVVSSLETIEVEYDSATKLLRDLKFMMQGNILLGRSKNFVSRKFFAEIEKNMLKMQNPSNQGFIAKFEVIFVVGRRG